jgi:protein TonB
MTVKLFLDSLFVWSLQVMMLVAAAGITATWLKHARARLYAWHGVLGLALLLPVIMPSRLPEPILVTQESGLGTVTVSTHEVIPVPARGEWWHGNTMLWLLAGIAAARVAWLGIGILKLHLLRRRAKQLNVPPIPFDRSAGWFVSDRVHGPVTFGWRNPSILLPREVVTLPQDLLVAVAGHELVHVLRRDWLVVVGEEVLRSVAWFHPGVWFALREIQIAREEVVDAAAVELTQNREKYLDALLAVAEQGLAPKLVPAPSFLRKRQLARRVAAILKETTMSKLNVAARVGLVVTATLAGLGAAAWFLPFPSAAQAVPDDAGISVQANGQLIHRPALHYPAGVTSGGVVVVDATLNSKGEVTDAHVVSGPDELRKTALANVLGWHYQGGVGSVQVTIQFAQPPVQRLTLAPQAITAPVPRGVVGGISPTPLVAPPPPPPPAPAGFPATLRVVRDIVFDGIEPGAQDQLRSRLPVHVGDTLDGDTLSKVSAAVKEFDPDLGVAFSNAAASPDGSQGITLRIRVNGAPVVPAPAPLLAASPNVPGALRMGSNVQSAALVNKVTPAYPPLAKAARIQGTVSFNALIGTDGAIKDLTLISGHPLLIPAATEAVKQWVYKPTLLNGQPVEVQTQIDVSFTLSE